MQAYSRATCHDWKAHDAFAGKLMRYWFSYIEWGNNTEMDVRCVDPELNSEGHLDFLTMFNSMRASKICPVFPGDSASTRRLSEIFLAGCVPAFLGPPYHSMPFGETVGCTYECKPEMDVKSIIKIEESCLVAEQDQDLYLLCPYSV